MSDLNDLDFQIPKAPEGTIDAGAEPIVNFAFFNFFLLNSFEVGKVCVIHYEDSCVTMTLFIQEKNESQVGRRRARGKRAGKKLSQKRGRLEYMKPFEKVTFCLSLFLCLYG